MGLLDELRAKAAEREAEELANSSLYRFTEADLDLAAESLHLEEVKEEAAELIVEGKKSGTFLQKQYSLFSCPTLIIYIQGPKLSLPSKDIETSWLEYFSPAFLSTRKLGYRGELSPTATSLIAEIASTPQKLYTDKDWHKALLGKLLAEGVTLNKGKVASPDLVKATLKGYWTDLEEWLAANNYSSIKVWEEVAKQTLIDTPLTLNDLDW